MKKIWTFIRHNPGIFIGFALMPLVLIYAYGCQSVVVSLVDQNRKVTRSELIAEVDLILAQAEAKFEDLNRQDLIKSTLFNSTLELVQGKVVSPAGIALLIGDILGIGAIIDNVRKRTHINTLKGESLNVKVKEQVERVVHRPNP